MTGLDYVSGLALDQNGNLYVAQPLQLIDNSLRRGRNRQRRADTQAPRRAVKIAHLGALQNRTLPGGHLKIAHLM